MLSKTILTIAIAALLCQSSFSAIAQKKRASMSTMKGSQRITKAVRRVRTLKDAIKDPVPKDTTKDPAPKDPKDTKAPMGTKAPKLTKVPKSKAPTAAPTTATTAPVQAQSDEEPSTEVLDSEAPSHSPTAPVVVLDADTLDPPNCTINTDCGDGWFCMEQFKLCCEFNTTCKVASAPGTSGTSTFYYGLLATTVYGVVLSIMLW